MKPTARTSKKWKSAGIHRTFTEKRGRNEKHVEEEIKDYT